MASNNPGEGSRRLLQLPDNRRIANTTDSTAYSRTSSLNEALKRNLALEDSLGEDTINISIEEGLKRMLSLKSVVSTSSSFAQRQQEAIGTTPMFREIGTGSIGKVFEHPGTIFAYKLPVTDQHEKLWNNYIMHKRIESSFQQLPHFDERVEIPRCFWYATPDTKSFWDKNIDFFPHTLEFPRKERHVLCMERILPLPRPIRYALIDKYCPPKARSQMKVDNANKDCMIRPCLGRVKYGSGGQFFSLRNFKLHANQMQDLGLSADDFYIDIEFVLGSSPSDEQVIRSDIGLEKVVRLAPQTSTYEEATNSTGDFTKRVISLWMIDFDDCGDITMDNDGVDKAVKAFLETNLYCPKPNTGHKYIEDLWKGFSQQYIQHRDRIFIDYLNRMDLCQLSRQFISKISTQTSSRQQPVQTTQQAGRRSSSRAASSRGQRGDGKFRLERSWRQ
ncbi:hypothetical protein ACHAQJ_002973 [Trichoderma viride]